MKTGPVWNILHTSTLFAWLYQCASVLKHSEIKTMPDFLRRHCSFAWRDCFYNHKEPVVLSGSVITDEIVRKILLYRVFNPPPNDLKKNIQYLHSVLLEQIIILLYSGQEKSAFLFFLPRNKWLTIKSSSMSLKTWFICYIYTLILLFLRVNTT